MPTSASACIATTPTSRRPRRKVLRFLLLLPGGDRKDGLAQMLRARDPGPAAPGRSRLPAPHHLFVVRAANGASAVGCCATCSSDYPRNPLFLACRSPRFRTPTSTTSPPASRPGSSLLDPGARRPRQRGGCRRGPRPARHRAASRALAETDEAIDQLERIIALKPAAPYAVAGAGLPAPRRGARSGQRARRRDGRLPQRARRRGARGDPHDIRRQAAERLRKTPNAAPRRSVPALARRLAEAGTEGRRRRAQSALERSLALNPRDPVARYRYGRVLRGAARRRRGAGAVRASHPRGPRLPAADPRPRLPRAAQTHERTRRARSEAITAYRTASTLFGAGGDTHRAAARALTRLEGALIRAHQPISRSTRSRSSRRDARSRRASRSCIRDHVFDARVVRSRRRCDVARSIAKSQCRFLTFRALCA